MYVWLVCIEWYFHLNMVHVHDKMEVMVLKMEDMALNLYQWWEEQAPLRTWDKFKMVVMRRFHPGLLHNPMRPLSSLRQKGIVVEYIRKFEIMVAPLRREEIIMLNSIFLNGLKRKFKQN